MRCELGSLRLSNETTGEQFQRFVGAIEAGRRMLTAGDGGAITLRILNDPYAFDRGASIPLDIYAEIELPLSSPVQAQRQGAKSNGR